MSPKLRPTPRGESLERFLAKLPDRWLVICMPHGRESCHRRYENSVNEFLREAAERGGYEVTAPFKLEKPDYQYSTEEALAETDVAPCCGGTYAQCMSGGCGCHD